MVSRGETLCILVFICPLLVCGLRRHHNRRSIAFDDRLLGFKFENEPYSGFTRNGNFILHCQYIIEKVDVKDVRLEWKKDGSLVSYKGFNNRIQLHSNGSLSISDASVVDEGWYQCIIYITSFGGSTWTFMSRKALVQFPELPKFEVQPIDHTVARGQPVVFHCLMYVRPIATVVWYHNEQVISENDEIHILPVSHSLEISSVQQHHEGEYKCVVEGAEKRRTSHVAQLRVDYNSIPTELIFLSAPRMNTVDEGEDILLECLATAKSRPEVRWLKDTRQITVDGIRIRHIGVSSLIITSASISDAGLYTCRASSVDDSLDRTVAVDVRAPPHLTTRPQDKIALETADVEFECLATGRPLPLISWYKNGEAIIATEYFVIEAYRLRILGLVKTDQGVYQCMAENEVGSEQAAAQLLVDSAGPTYLFTIGLGNVTLPMRTITIPPLPADDSSSVAASSGQPLVASAPLGLRTGSIGSRFVTLEWDPPVQRHGHIMRYHVFYKEEDSDRERMLNSSTTSTTLTALQPNTLYLLRVAAENEAGVGKTSDHIKITTKKEQAVPGRVINLKAYSLGPETIEVRWDPPMAGPSALRYKLFYIRNPPGNDKETQTIIPSTQYTLHGMEKFTEYLIRVEAEGENGSGLSSETLKVRTLSDVPSSAPRDIVAEPSSSTSVRVTWVEPEEENINGEITGYRLKYKTKLRGSKGNTFVIDATEREYTITGLDPNTQYLVRMAVVNHNGTGPYSDWLRVDTLLADKEEALLGAPRELRPQAGPDYILISWLPPADETILVRGYQIGWGHNVPDLSTERVGASVLQHKITGLKAARDYVVSLRAFNKQGSGFPIYETVRTLSHGPGLFFSDINSVDAASTPLGVRAEVQSATSIRVSWTEPDPNAFNTLYTVRYSTSSDGNQLRYVNSSESWVLIDNLRPSTEYEFAVRAAASGGGISQWSMAARNKTFASAPSSAPRDLTVLPAASGDPHSVSLNWQPPKYANGEIEEYLIYYTDRSSLADKDWIINYVPGDRLNHHVNNLLPKTTYHFKIQARNEKGYGPLSTIHSFFPSVVSRPSGILHPASSSDNHWKELIIMLTSNRMYLAVVTVFILLMLLCIILVAVCFMKRSTKQKRGYTAAKKSSSHQQSNDMWINHPTGSHVRGGVSDYTMEVIGATMTDMKHLSGPEVVESPPPRYQALQDSAYGSVSVRHSRTPIRQSVSSYEDGETRRPLIVGRAKPILASANSYGAGEENSQGTLSRSYHHSSTSLEGRQRTPQVVYTGSGRHQPIAKIDFPDSPYGSSSALAPGTPPFPVQAPPNGPPAIIDGYRTLRGTPPGANPLRSFTQLAGAPPTSQPRPVVIAAGGRKLPVGRATAQPRVNVANIYSPYATCSSDTETEKKQAQVEIQPTEHASNIQPSNSTEELNAHIQDLDNVVGDLQDWQAEFESM